MSDNGQDLLPQVQAYQRIVERYEKLDEEIDGLIMAHNGATENMSPEDLKRYRELARQRDELLNEMRIMERRLLPEDDSSP